MGLERRCLVYKFSIDRVFYLSVNSHGNSLLHFIASHFSDPFFSIVPFHEEIIFLCSSLLIQYSILPRVCGLHAISSDFQWPIPDGQIATSEALLFRWQFFL